MPKTLIEIPAEQLNEIPIVIVVVITVFVFLISVGVFFLIRYQRKKYEYMKNLIMLQKENEAAILRSQLEIQEQTFEAVSLEIHDNVGQILSLAKIQLNIAQSTLQDTSGILEAAKENIGQVMIDLRDIAKSMNTDRISQLDLGQAFNQEADRISKTQIITCRVDVGGIPQPINTTKKIIVFRLVQETLNNVLKHAKATNVIISVNYQDDQFAILVNDNGQGFDIERIPNNGLGLQNISKRAALIGGQAEIKSISGQGTTVIITIPYE